MKTKRNILLVFLLSLCFSAVIVACNSTYELNLTATSGGSVSGGGKYNVGDSVTITATEELGYSFVGWYLDGDEWDTNATYTFTMSEKKLDLEARFVKNKYEVKVNKTGSGTITGAGEHEYQSQVTLTATPDQGYKFDGWFNPATAQTATSTNTTYTFAMPYEAVTVKAVFTLDNYTLTINKEGEGTVTGAGSHAYGAEVVVTATAATGYTFTGWYDPDNATTPLATTASYTFNMPYSATTIKAVFTANIHEVIVAVVGGGEVDGAGDYGYGTKVTLEATADENYHFVGWFHPSDPDDPLSEDLIYEFDMIDEEITIRAVFEGDPFGVTVEILSTTVEEPVTEAHGTVNNAGEYAYGSVVTLTATPTKSHYWFIGWFDKDGAKIDNDDDWEVVVSNSGGTITFTMPAEDITIKAEFKNTRASM